MNFTNILGIIGGITGPIGIGIQAISFWINKPKIQIKLSELNTSVYVSWKYLYDNSNIPDYQKYHWSDDTTVALISLEITNKGQQPISISSISCYYPNEKDWWEVSSHSISLKHIPITSKDNGFKGSIDLPLGKFVSFPLRLDGNDAKEIKIACLGNVLNKDGYLKIKYNSSTSHKVLSLKIRLLRLILINMVINYLNRL